MGTFGGSGRGGFGRDRDNDTAQRKWLDILKSQETRARESAHMSKAQYKTFMENNKKLLEYSKRQAETMIKENRISDAKTFKEMQNAFAGVDKLGRTLDSVVALREQEKAILKGLDDAARRQKRYLDKKDDLEVQIEKERKKRQALIDKGLQLTDEQNAQFQSILDELTIYQEREAEVVKGQEILHEQELALLKAEHDANEKARRKMLGFWGRRSEDMYFFLMKATDRIEDKLYDVWEGGIDKLKDAAKYSKDKTIEGFKSAKKFWDNNKDDMKKFLLKTLDIVKKPLGNYMKYAKDFFMDSLADTRQHWALVFDNLKNSRMGRATARAGTAVSGAYKATKTYVKDKWSDFSADMGQHWINTKQLASDRRDELVAGARRVGAKTKDIGLRGLEKALTGAIWAKDKSVVLATAIAGKISNSKWVKKAEGYYTKAKDYVSGAKDRAKQFTTWLGGTFVGKMGKSVGKFAGGAMERITDSFKSLGKSLKKMGGKGVGTGMGMLGIALLAGAAVGWLINKILPDDVKEKIGEWTAKVVDFVKGVWDFFGNVGSLLGQGMAYVVDFVTYQIPAFFGRITDFFTIDIPLQWAQFQAWWSTWSFAGLADQYIYTPMTEFFLGAFTWIGNKKTEFMDWWEGFSFTDALKDAFTSISNAVLSKMDKMGEKVANFLGLDWGGIKAAGKAVYSAGAGAFSTVAEKVSSGANWTKNLLGLGDKYGRSQTKLATGETVDAQIYSDITTAAKSGGIDPGIMLAMARQESGFGTNMAASTSSAKGLFQFTKGTWADYAKKLGYSAEDVNDPAKNARAAAELLNDNKKYMEARGIKAGPNELYAAHFLGKGGAVSFLQALNSNPAAIGAQLFPDAAKANAGIFYDENKNPRTLAEIYGTFNKKVGNYAATYSGSGTTQAAAPAVASAMPVATTAPAMPSTLMPKPAPAVPPPAAPQSQGAGMAAANNAPSANDIPMVVSDTGLMITTAVAAYT